MAWSCEIESVHVKVCFILLAPSSLSLSLSAWTLLYALCLPFSSDWHISLFSLLSLFSLFNHLSTIFKTYCPPQMLPLLILISFFKIIQNYLPLKSSFRMFSFLSQVSFILFLDPTPTFMHISLSLSLSTFTHSQFPQSMSCRRIIFKRQRYSYSLSIHLCCMHAVTITF